MKITLSYTIELDPLEWDNGALGGDARAVRDDVRIHLFHALLCDSLLNEAEATVTDHRRGVSAPCGER